MKFWLVHRLIHGLCRKTLDRKDLRNQSKQFHNSTKIDSNYKLKIISWLILTAKFLLPQTIHLI